MSGYTPYEGRPTSQFNEHITVSKEQIINLKSIYGLSNLRDIQKITGSATITNANGEYKLTTTANGTDSAILESAERGRYYAGQDSLAGIGIRLAQNPVENQEVRWGYFDDDNGYGYGKDTTGLFVFTKDGGETKVYQKDWRLDKLNGTGPSALKLKETDGVIYHINFSWYGYGTVSFNIVYFDKDTNEQKTVTVHRIRVTEKVSTRDPNLPIRVQVNNNGSTVAFDSIYVGGRQFSTYGKKANARRITSERRLEITGIGTTEVPMVSFRRKSTYESVSVKVSGFDIITDFNAVVEVRTNSNLTGAVFQTPTNHNATETAVESDISATAVTGGEILHTALVFSGKGNQEGMGTVPLLEQDFGRLDPVTVTIRRISGTGGTATCVFRVAEEW